MDAQELRNLQEAYEAVYENQEQLDGNILEGSYEDRIAANNKKYDANRKRAAQRAEARNEARRRGQTGNVPGVGYVSPRPERTTYRDSAGVERHHSGAKMPKNEEVETDFFDEAKVDTGLSDVAKKDIRSRRYVSKTKGSEGVKNYDAMGSNASNWVSAERRRVHKASRGVRKEEIDLFDYLLEYLVAEGYADTNEAALVIMANMSEDWREDIIEAYQEPRFGKKDYIKKLFKRGGMGMGTPEDPHGYRDPKMAKVGAEFSKRKTAAAKAKKTGEPDSYRAEKEAQSKNR